MFTGLVTGVGRLLESRDAGGDLRLRFATPPGFASALALGESVAVSGVCLTVLEPDENGFAADVSRETLRCTTLGKLAIGAPVNLEQALLPSTRLGGHFVSGHVDGVGTLLSTKPEARSQRWRFQAPAALTRYFAAKGSICIEGVSLTVNEVAEASFTVNLIPHTLQNTTLGSLTVGASVNLEVDLLARYLERLVQQRVP